MLSEVVCLDILQFMRGQDIVMTEERTVRRRAQAVTHVRCCF